MTTRFDELAFLKARIAHVNAQPNLVVHDVGELNAVLFELHWLYSHFTNEVDAFVQAHTAARIDDLHKVIRSHTESGNNEATQQILRAWMDVSRRLRIL